MYVDNGGGGARAGRDRVRKASYNNTERRKSAKGVTRHMRYKKKGETLLGRACPVLRTGPPSL